MKILIIAANREASPDPVFPIGASYIAFAAKQAGHEVIIYDACFQQEPIANLAKSINENKPDIIAISIRNVDNNAFPIAINYLPYYKEILDTCRKNSSAKIIIGGSGFSIFPELFMNELKPDYGIKGEGEYEFVALLKKIDSKQKITNKLFYSSKIKDINYDNFPDRTGFDIDQYYKFGGCINIQTKRGCAFNCSYCTYPVLEGNEYRFRTPQKVVDEIKYWYDTKGFSYFFFVDNVFNHPEDYATKICEEIIKRNLKIKWTGFFIPKFSNEEFINICAESGLTGIDFGTDAFSTNTLKGFNKQFTVEDIFYACEVCKKKNIKYNHSLIFGGPGETRQTLDDTFDNVIKSEASAVIGFIGVRLYAGTPMANEIKNATVGIDPIFYISEDVKDFLIEYLAEKTKNLKTWIIPGLNKCVNPEFFNRIRKRGIKGPLWEMISKVNF